MEVELEVHNGLVMGHCVSEFQPLLDEFVRNFNERVYVSSENICARTDFRYHVFFSLKPKQFMPGFYVHFE